MLAHATHTKWPTRLCPKSILAAISVDTHEIAHAQLECKSCFIHANVYFACARVCQGYPSIPYIPEANASGEHQTASASLQSIPYIPEANASGEHHNDVNIANDVNTSGEHHNDDSDFSFSFSRCA